MKRKIISGVVLLGATALALGLGACKAESADGDVEKGGAIKPSASKTSAAPAVNDGPVVAAVGDAVNLTGTSDGQTVSKIKAGVGEIKLGVASEYLKPKAGNVFVCIRFSVEATQGSYDANPFKINFVDTDGNRYDKGFGAQACSPELHAVSLTTGRKAAGWVVFEAPTDVAKSGVGTQVELTGTLGNPLAVWTW